MTKAVEAFRNIGEVSEEIGVKKHVLRFWEAKFPQLKPMKRGGGRRLYRPADIELLRGLHDLLQNKGYTIRGVQKILREDGVEAVKAAIRAASGQIETLCANPSGTVTVSNSLAKIGPAEVRALRAIVVELDACRSLLGAADVAAPASQRPRRALRG